jgi:hypothetical protein
MSSFFGAGTSTAGQLDVIKLHSTIKSVCPRGGAAIVEVRSLYFIV